MTVIAKLLQRTHIVPLFSSDRQLGTIFVLCHCQHKSDRNGGSFFINCRPARACVLLLLITSPVLFFAESGVDVEKKADKIAGETEKHGMLC